MAERVCPWWMGPLLLNPLRRWTLRPERLLAPWVREGMNVLEPGPGMGFFTLPLAILVGPAGKVFAIDIQPKMVEKLRRRVEHARLFSRVEIRLAPRDSLQIPDLVGSIDFALAFAMVHETPSVEKFFRELAAALKPGGSLLLVEPSGHVHSEKFASELEAARAAGLQTAASPTIRGNHAALLRKS
jgi:ubiquinone/menaquinone biosynthesis C-methylase UbiE